MKLIFKGKPNSGNYNLRNFKLLRLSEDLIKNEVTKEIKVVKLVTWGMSNTKIE